jgi:hypothetical protein
VVVAVVAADNSLAVYPITAILALLALPKVLLGRAKAAVTEAVAVVVAVDKMAVQVALLEVATTVLLVEKMATIWLLQGR